jgi:hypothetical protein
MSNNLKGHLELEHRDDYSYLTLHGREFIITNYAQDYDTPYGRYSYDWDRYGRRLSIKLDLWEVPPKPKYRPKRRSWATSMGLRKPPG